MISEVGIKLICDIIEKYYEGIIVRYCGHEYVSVEKLNQLIREGIVDSADLEGSAVADGYLIGRLRQILPEQSLEDITPKEFRKRFRHFLITLPESEQKKLKIAKESAYNAIVGLKDQSVAKMRGVLVSNVFDHINEHLGEPVKNVIEEAYIQNKSLGKLVGDLKRMAKDWSSKWSTVATTEMTRAINAGAADGIIARNRDVPPDEIYCYFAVVKDGRLCKHCQRLHLHPDGTPRVFKMSELIANGSNYGRKASEYKPSLHGLHPNCRCVVAQIPNGWGFDRKGHIKFKSPTHIEYNKKK